MTHSNPNLVSRQIVDANGVLKTVWVSPEDSSALSGGKITMLPDSLPTSASRSPMSVADRKALVVRIHEDILHGDRVRRNQTPAQNLAHAGYVHPDTSSREENEIGLTELYGECGQDNEVFAEMVAESGYEYREDADLELGAHRNLIVIDPDYAILAEDADIAMQSMEPVDALSSLGYQHPEARDKKDNYNRLIHVVDRARNPVELARALHESGIVKGDDLQ